MDYYFSLTTVNYFTTSFWVIICLAVLFGVSPHKGDFWNDFWTSGCHFTKLPSWWAPLCDLAYGTKTNKWTKNQVKFMIYLQEALWKKSGYCWPVNKNDLQLASVRRASDIFSLHCKHSPGTFSVPKEWRRRREISFIHLQTHTQIIIKCIVSSLALVRHYYQVLHWETLTFVFLSSHFAVVNSVSVLTSD